MTRITNADVRRIIQWATSHGWEYEGMTGSSHHRIRYWDGSPVTLPNSPSDNRGLLNTLAEIRRICGELPPKAQAGHYRHISRRGEAFSMDAAVAERESREKQCRDMHDKHARLLAELRDLVDARMSEQTRIQASRLVRELLHIERLCVRLNDPIQNPIGEQ